MEHSNMKDFKVSKDFVKKYSECIIEAFGEHQLPNVIKKVSYEIRKDIINNGDNSFQKKYNFWNLDFNIAVNYTNQKKEPYYSFINIYDILSKTNEPINIGVTVKDEIIDINYLMSVISHEIRHVYDIFTISHDTEFKSFTKTININKYFETKFSYFADLVYLSLEHELIARHNMLYELYRWINITDKNELMKLFKESFVNKSLVKLKSFNSVYYIKQFNNDELKYFIIKFSKDINDDSFNGNVNDYFKNWENFFNKKSDEFYNLVDGMLDDIINDIINNKLYERLCGFKCHDWYILENYTKEIFEKMIILKNEM